MTGFLEHYDRISAGLKQWRPKIEQSLQYSLNSHTFDDVCGMIFSGQLHFYAFPNSFVIMELKHYPQYNAYHCFLAGGDLNEVLHSQDQIMPIAAQAGCKYVTLSGRKGWERAFSTTGWQPLCTTLYKLTGQEN